MPLRGRPEGSEKAGLFSPGWLPRPLSTMKTIHKRLYQSFPVIPRSVNASSSPKATRVRSNSASSPRSLYTANGPSFFDSGPPPPPSSRGHNIVSPARLPLEAKTEIELQLNLQHNSGPNQHVTPYSQSQSSGPHPPFSLALTTPTSHQSSSYNPLSHYTPIFPYQSLKAGPSSGVYASADPEPSTSTKRHTPRYHLDVGAYGIPKRSNRHSPPLSRSVPASHEAGYFAVQVGEDAYFVRDNALGVADGVGGWSRTKHCDVALATKGLTDSPSALFARRIMHYCAEEVEASTSSHLNHDFSSFSAHPPPSHLPSSALHPPRYNDFPFSHLAEDSDCEEYEYDELDDPIDEFEEGLDVLMILERAYDKALKAHVVPAAATSATPSASSSAAKHTIEPEAPSLHCPLPPPDLPPTSDTVPLLIGSSTALFAVLDYATHKPSQSSWREPSIGMSVPEGVEGHVGGKEPVIKIAHLGDCMGMLVRGEEIVWRSEEMWSNFNTPLQLGPSSSTRPRDAHVFTIPVHADDILILTSDGLSDNLWDEEVLDEVIRFKRTFLAPSSHTHLSRNMPYPSQSQKVTSILGRRTLAGMLSESLCSRARKVSERPPRCSRKDKTEEPGKEGQDKEDETPFARKAREQGRWFSGGKSDDISVLVALISPATSLGGPASL
ncbi:hypothetical protein NEOLEDRAFT_1174619 [Neolentinus lepideus HHB14362 ss-1]|uniref:Protein phosphatase n=1 Tax=Neolentinus lepideus HHB14362 ss-1 TaxID=1314782 RepID=A0A165VX16_9AGAM|nr:hypothetical protein NEOLEDRAFT_1174619 [Neolentinus lepideus HHB14362 ss-1]